VLEKGEEDFLNDFLPILRKEAKRQKVAKQRIA